MKEWEGDGNVYIFASYELELANCSVSSPVGKQVVRTKRPSYLQCPWPIRTKWVVTLTLGCTHDRLMLGVIGSTRSSHFTSVHFVRCEGGLRPSARAFCRAVWRNFVWRLHCNAPTAGPGLVSVSLDRSESQAITAERCWQTCRSIINARCTL